MNKDLSCPLGVLQILASPSSTLLAKLCLLDLCVEERLGANVGFEWNGIVMRVTHTHRELNHIEKWNPELDTGVRPRYKQSNFLDVLQERGIFER